MGPTGDRRFSRFATGRSTDDGYWPLPPDGLCLSSFVLVSRPDRPREVLVGRIDPTADWGRIGALDARRVEQNAAGWMLPSSHLLYFESPEGAARRVLQEQLALEGVALSPVQVFSEKYPPRRHPERGDHWDLEFVFRANVRSGWTPQHPAWREPRFLDPSTTPRSEFTRSHDEVLELAGFSVAGPEPGPRRLGRVSA